MANILVFLPWEPHEQYEKTKRQDMRDELPRLIGAQYATGDEWRNNCKKNEEMEPKLKQHPLQMWLVMEVKSDAVKNNIA